MKKRTVTGGCFSQKSVENTVGKNAREMPISRLFLRAFLRWFKCDSERPNLCIAYIAEQAVSAGCTKLAK